MNELLLLGILFSLIFTEFTDLSPGGIIVPAYFAMYCNEPWRLAMTAAAALLCVAVVRFFSGYMILYGRRRFAVYIMTGILLRFLAAFAVPGSVLSIGWLIPGLLGKDIEKQGPILTLLSLGAVTLAVCLVSAAVQFLF